MVMQYLILCVSILEIYQFLTWKLVVILKRYNMSDEYLEASRSVSFSWTWNYTMGIKEIPNTHWLFSLSHWYCNPFGGLPHIFTFHSPTNICIYYFCYCLSPLISTFLSFLPFLFNLHLYTCSSNCRKLTCVCHVWFMLHFTRLPNSYYPFVSLLVHIYCIPTWLC